MASPLWMTDQIDIPYLGVHGEINTGKTLFLLEIRPERTIYYGFEESAATYSRMADLKTVVEAHDRVAQNKQNYTSLDIWRWWEKHVLSLPKGEYDVIAIDTIGDPENGLADHVATLYADFGFSSEESFRKTKGLFWSRVKEHLEAVLHKARVNAGVQTIAYAAHMRQEWKDGSPTRRRIPEGKDTWNKLASLVIELQRKPDEKGNVPERPIGIVRKGRLAVPVRDKDGTIQRDKYGDAVWKTCNPPRIKDCTPGRIRFYIENPPDYTKLKKDERAEPETMTEEEKLELQARIQANRREAVELEMERDKTKAQKAADAARQRAAQKAAQSSKPQPKPQPKSEPAKQADTPAPAAGESGDNGEPLGEHQGMLAEIPELLKKLGLSVDDEKFKAVLQKRGAEKLEDLDPQAAKDICMRMRNKVMAKELEADFQKQRA